MGYATDLHVVAPAKGKTRSGVGSTPLHRQVLDKRKRSQAHGETLLTAVAAHQPHSPNTISQNKRRTRTFETPGQRRIDFKRLKVQSQGKLPHVHTTLETPVTRPQSLPIVQAVLIQPSEVETPKKMHLTTAGQATQVTPLPRHPIPSSAQQRKCRVRVVPKTEKARRIICLSAERPKLEFSVKMCRSIRWMIDKHLMKKWGAAFSAATASRCELRLTLVVDGEERASWAALPPGAESPLGKKKKSRKVAADNSEKHTMEEKPTDNTLWDVTQASTVSSSEHAKHILLKYDWRQSAR